MDPLDDAVKKKQALLAELESVVGKLRTAHTDLAKIVDDMQNELGEQNA